MGYDKQTSENYAIYDEVRDAFNAYSGALITYKEAPTEENANAVTAAQEQYLQLMDYVGNIV